MSDKWYNSRSLWEHTFITLNSSRIKLLYKVILFYGFLAMFSRLKTKKEKKEKLIFPTLRHVSHVG